MNRSTTAARPRCLTREQIDHAATEHGVEGAALRAVIRVETGGRSGFLPDGRPRILLERHVLWKRLQIRRIDPGPLGRAHPELCGPDWNPRRYPYGSEAGQWTRVDTVAAYGGAHGLRESYAKAAWEACSWGLFQLLGMNYADAGFPDVVQLKRAHEAGEAEQLEAALRWMTHTGVLEALRKRDWSHFAFRYNGPGQVARYAGLLAAAYEREVGASYATPASS